MFEQRPTPEEIIATQKAERLAAQLAGLAEMAQIGLELAREILEQTKAQGVGALRIDPGLAYGRISRAYQLHLILQTQLADEHRSLIDQAAKAKRDASLARTKEDVVIAMRDMLRPIMDVTPNPRGSELRRLYYHLPQLPVLEKEDYLLTAPVSTILRYICETHDLTIDWSLWEDEIWAFREHTDKHSPYFNPRCLLTEEEDPDEWTDDPAEVDPDTEPVLA